MLYWSPTLLGPLISSGDSSVTAPPWLCPGKHSHQHMALIATSQGLLCKGFALSDWLQDRAWVHTGKSVFLATGEALLGQEGPCACSSVMVPCAQPPSFPVNLLEKLMGRGGSREVAQGASSRGRGMRGGRGLRRAEGSHTQVPSCSSKDQKPQVSVTRGPREPAGKAADFQGGDMTLASHGVGGSP